MKWITATDLDKWADTIPARANFPGLVADLIRASASDITSIRFPSGDKGQVRGFDGHLVAKGAPPYVPDGHSLWEFGVAKNPTKKAESDFEKRTAEVDEVTRQQTTFVFVSPRTIDSSNKKVAAGSKKKKIADWRTNWLTTKRNLGKWKNVEYVDGAMLEAWLANHAALASRFARFELNIMYQSGARSTDEFWEEYSTRFAPTLVEEVLLAGRESQAEELRKKLVVSSGILLYAAESPEEVIAFTVAAIRRADPASRLYLEARTIIVETEEAARQLAVKSGLIFLPWRQAKCLAGLLAQRGLTVASAGADELRGKHELLVRPDSTTLGKAFTAMGYSETKGYEIARECGRSLAVLARRYPSATAEQPEWFYEGEKLLPALLAGAWNSSLDQDKAILQSLAGCDDYYEVEKPLRKLKKLNDPPLDQVSDVWAMRAPIDAFVYLAYLIGPEHLKRFSAAMNVVFSQVPPAPKPGDVFQLASQRNDTHSSWLRDGMMTTLLHMAVIRTNEFCVQGSTAQEYVNEIVRSLPGLSSDYRLMASLSNQLSLLAEAAPVPFLDALEHLLEGDAARIKPIFDEQKGLWSNHSFHNGLLWALETLAWLPDFLLRSAKCLARLAEIDPGGSTSNRPIESLKSIFLAWAPNTSANVNIRLGVLKHLLQEVPGIAWSLLAKLLPEYMGTTFPTEKPKHREPETKPIEIMTYGLIWETQAVIIDLTLERVGDDPGRWKTLIGSMSRFQPAPQSKTIALLETHLAALSENARFEIWDALRLETNHHHAYANTDWAFKETTLNQLDKIITKYEPDDVLRLNVWLFDEWMPDVRKQGIVAADPHDAIAPARLEAVKKISTAQGLSGLVELAARAKLPDQVAIAVRGLDLSRNQLLSLLELSLDGGQRIAIIGPLLVSDGFARYRQSWIDDLHKSFAVKKPNAEQVARLLMDMPKTRETWEIVRSFGKETEDYYWRHTRSFDVSGDTDDLLFCIENYVSRGSYLLAIEAASQGLEKVSSHILLSLLSGVIPQINSAPNGHGTLMFHFIEKTFDELVKRSDVPEKELAKLEFLYLPWFRRGKKPQTLHRLMTENAEFYMEVISVVFKPASGVPRQASDDERRLAMAAYRLLEGLRTLPGQRDTQIDFDVLSKWCAEVRELAFGADRAAVTDSRIGTLLAHAPPSSLDQAWPHEAVRKVINSIASADLEQGIITERQNMRGVFTKASGEGGKQEKALSDETREWAYAMPDFPRTAAMLLQLATCWAQDAKEEDERAEKEALRW